jgi:hypothetical protein
MAMLGALTYILDCRFHEAIAQVVGHGFLHGSGCSYIDPDAIVLEFHQRSATYAADQDSAHSSLPIVDTFFIWLPSISTAVNRSQCPKWADTPASSPPGLLLGIPIFILFVSHALYSLPFEGG